MKSIKALLKKGIAIAASAAAALAVNVNAYAEDYEADVSGAKQSTGSYGQSLTYYTCLGDPDGAADNFDPTRMTDASEVYIEYELEGEYVTGDDGYISAAPVQLIWQSWEGGVSNSEGAIWAQVAPYEFDEHSARFSFDDIAAAYGTEDFSTVYAINVGDTGVKLTVTQMSITNVAAEGGAVETEITESKAVEVALTTAAIVENAPTETNAAPLVMGVVIGVIAAAVIAAVIILMVRANKRKNY